MNKQTFVISGLILVILALVGAGVIVRADNTLTASISIPTSATVGESVNFSVQATGGSGAYSYVWNFGDGEQFGGPTPSHTYTTAGAKTVNVVVTDTDSNQTSASQTITINEVATPLTASITTPADNATFSTINPPIHFDVQVTGGSGFYSYVWNFGDGEQSGDQTPEHYYSATGTKTVTVVVTDTDNNQASDSINLTILGPALPPVTPAPTVNFTANGQTGSLTVATTTPVTLAWTATEATACAASGDWTGAKSTSGSESVGPFATANSTKTFTLTCTGAGGNTVRTVTVTTSNDSTTTDLIITNVRVTDITKNSVVIRWDTNLSANSRVIYDLVSHSSIAGQSAPNYGYQFSTATDSALITSHAVTVSGLSANTHYYFRVISEN
jgi:PKD repeat protein